MAYYSSQRCELLWNFMWMFEFFYPSVFNCLSLFGISKQLPRASWQHARVSSPLNRENDGTADSQTKLRNPPGLALRASPFLSARENKESIWLGVKTRKRWRNIRWVVPLGWIHTSVIFTPSWTGTVRIVRRACGEGQPYSRRVKLEDWGKRLE